MDVKSKVVTKYSDVNIRNISYTGKLRKIQKIKWTKILKMILRMALKNKIWLVTLDYKDYGNIQAFSKDSNISVRLIAKISYYFSVKMQGKKFFPFFTFLENLEYET